MVFEDNHLAIAALIANKFNHAVGSGLDGRAGGRCIVDAIVIAPAAVDRVAALAKGGTDTGEFNGVTQKSTLQAVALKVVIAARAIVISKPQGLVRVPRFSNSRARIRPAP